MTEEYIEREAARKAIYQYLLEQTVDKYGSSELCIAVRSGASAAMEVMYDVPAADVAPVVHGEWENVSDFMPIYRCSNCKERNLFKNGDNVLSNYCPNCGAKMDGGER